MNERSYTTMDKSDWGDGAWNDEPDKLQWIDESTGLDCLIVRNHHGSLCGYVGVPPEHPYHGRDYSEIDVDVHGGLTYADSCQEGAEDKAVCHVPAAGRPANVWWFGFDCGHAWDISPALEARMREIPSHRQLSALMKKYEDVLPGESYKPISYVRAEVLSLAGQLVL